MPEVPRERAKLGPEAYRALYDNSPDGVLFTIPDGTVIAANPAACRLLGRSEEEICRLGRDGLTDHGDPRWSEMLTERSRSGTVRGVGRMLRGDGSAIDVEVSVQLFRDSEGAERTCTILRDVTERVAMERDLRAGRERLAEAERVAQIGSWEWDVVADHVTWSDGLFQIYGLDKESFDPTRGGGDRRIVPEDRARVRRVTERALAERGSFVIEYRAVRADGRVRTLENRGEVVVDDAGNPVRMVGIARDVTEAAQAREALETASLDLERRALELQGLTRAGAVEERETPAAAALTPRQLEILRLVAAGLTSDQIAERLFLTRSTVKWHVKQILAKTGAANRAEAVARVLGGERG